MKPSLVQPDRAASVMDEIEGHLLEALAGINEQSVNKSIVLEIRNNIGALVGGVIASTSYGWLLVKILWVREDLRGDGFGQALMDAVEAEGRAVGCHSAWLDTSNAQARDFYLKRGYADFGVLENGPGRAPDGHARWFMKRNLAST